MHRRSYLYAILCQLMPGGASGAHVMRCCQSAIEIGEWLSCRILDAHQRDIGLGLIAEKQ